jgi:hypothetical protein
MNMKNMKKLLAALAALTMFGAGAIVAAADEPDTTDEPPSRKTQIDWLIYGAGGNDLEGRRGAEADVSVTGEFFYAFASECGELIGSVRAGNGEIEIRAIDDCEETIALAERFTRHFAALSRINHFHDSHPLSLQATEEYLIAQDSSTFMTFCYDRTADGRMMRAMILDDEIKFVFMLTNAVPETGYGIPPLGIIEAMADEAAEFRESRAADTSEPPTSTAPEASEAPATPESPPESEESEASEDSEFPTVIVVAAAIGVAAMIGAVVIMAKKGGKS